MEGLYWVGVILLSVFLLAFACTSLFRKFQLYLFFVFWALLWWWLASGYLYFLLALFLLVLVSLRGVSSPAMGFVERPSFGWRLFLGLGFCTGLVVWFGLCLPELRFMPLLPGDSVLRYFSLGEVLADIGAHWEALGYCLFAGVLLVLGLWAFVRKGAV